MKRTADVGEHAPRTTGEPMSLTGRIDQADRELANAAWLWSLDDNRARADRELREAVFVYRLALDEVRDNVRTALSR